MVSREQEAAEAAAVLILFCDGIQELHPTLAKRSRHLAYETLWLVDSLLAERRLRRVMQEQRDEARATMLERLHGERPAA